MGVVGVTGHERELLAAAASLIAQAAALNPPGSERRLHLRGLAVRAIGMSQQRPLVAAPEVVPESPESAPQVIHLFEAAQTVQ